MQELIRYISRLKEVKTEFAEAKLARPSDRTEFGYGEACGEYKGLCRAEKLLEQVIEEVADDESK